MAEQPCNFVSEGGRAGADCCGGWSGLSARPAVTVGCKFLGQESRRSSLLQTLPPCVCASFCSWHAPAATEEYMNMKSATAAAVAGAVQTRRVKTRGPASFL